MLAEAQVPRFVALACLVVLGAVRAPQRASPPARAAPTRG
jgi:hypothetical protein